MAAKKRLYIPLSFHYLLRGLVPRLGSRVNIDAIRKLAELKSFERNYLSENLMNGLFMEEDAFGMHEIPWLRVSTLGKFIWRGNDPTIFLC